MTKGKKIENFSLGYYLLKRYVDICFHNFYKISYKGKKSVNLNDTLIFAGNHQNALMDALSILTAFQWQPVFLARSDIFKNPWTARILSFLKILPVYRIRDGYGELHKNDFTFRKTVDILKNRNGIGILPEGNHQGQRRLRTLKKGIARIAFKAAFQSQEELDIKIIPTGINYQDYHTQGSRLFIHFGTPIKLSDFRIEYRENPAHAYNLLLKELGNKLKEVMLHIEYEENYPTADTCVEIVDTFASCARLNPPEILDMQRLAITKTQELYLQNKEEYQQLKNATEKLNAIKTTHKLNFADIGLIKSQTSSLKMFLRLWTLLISGPLFVYAYIQNILPSISTYHLSANPKDPQFKSSFHFVVAIFLFPLFYLLQSLILWISINNGLCALLYFLTLPLTLFIKNQWLKHFDIFRKSIKLKKIKSSIIKEVEIIIAKTGITIT